MADLATATRRWVRAVWLPFSLFLGALVALTLPAWRRNRFFTVVVLVALVVFAAWVNDSVRRDRREHADGGKARTFLATVQLALGIALFVAGWNGLWANVFVFLGLALAVTSGAALISEGRVSGVRRSGPWLLTLSALFVITALILSPGLSVVVLIGVGVVVGEIGTEFVSESSHRWSASAYPGWFALAGGALLATALLVLVLVGSAWPHALLVLGALMVVSWMASSDADSLAVLLVLALALVWASAPREVPEDSRRTAVPDHRYFLVLGDSYISGEGAPVYFEGTNRVEGNADHDNECRRAPTAWPVLLARSPPGDLPDRVLFLACSGAVTENISRHPRLEELEDGTSKQHGPSELDQYEQLAGELGPPAFVLLSIGGNDAGFGTIGTNCVGPGSCVKIGQQFLDDPDLEDVVPPADPDEPPGDGRPEDLAGIANDLDAAYDRVVRAVGTDVPVVVVPYPKPLGTVGSCSGVLFDADERRFLRAFVRELNDVVEAAAKRHGFYFMDSMEQSLEERGNLLCDESGLRAGLNFVALNPKEGTARDALNPANWFHNSLHPNPDGHDAMRDAAGEWFRDHPTLVAPQADPSVTHHQVRSLDQLLEDGEPVVECEPKSATSCQLEDSRWLKAQFMGLYRLNLGLMVVVMVGAWLLLAPAMWFGRDREISLTKIGRCALSRPRGASRES